MIKYMVKRQLNRISNYLLSDMNNDIKSTLALLGKNVAYRLQQIEEIDSLSDVEFKVHSQCGEDGIIEWLIQRLPFSSRRFIEFGVENYKESNTRFLLVNRNWIGLAIDADSNCVEQIRNDEIYWKHHLTACQAFITRENINDLITDNGFSGQIGLLSIDMDGNDYWVWDAIEVVQPDIVVCEYNSILGDVYPITVPYEKDFYRTQANFSNLYYGAGIRALEWLAERKGYIFLGSNSMGINAFFIRKELGQYVDHRIKNKKASPSAFRDSRDENHRLTFVGGLNRFEIIKYLPVLRLDTGETVILDSLSPVYSEAWIQEMAGFY